MRLLGKSSAALTADLAKIREGRRLQAVIRDGNGLDKQRLAAGKALEAHDAETARIKEERRRQRIVMQTQQGELEARHGNGQRAYHDLRGLKEQSPDVLRYVEVPERT